MAVTLVACIMFLLANAGLENNGSFIEETLS